MLDCSIPLFISYKFSILWLLSLPFSVGTLHNFLVLDWVFYLAEHGVLGADLEFVDFDVLAVGQVELFVLARQHRHFFRLVLPDELAFLVLRRGDAVLDFVLQVVVPLLQLLLVARLLVDLQGQLLLFAHLVRQVGCTLRHAPLGHLVEHLQLVEQLALVPNQLLLLVQLLPQLRELEVLVALFVLQSCLQLALVVLLHFDHPLLRAHLHPQNFSLALQLLLLLPQGEERLEE